MEKVNTFQKLMELIRVNGMKVVQMAMELQLMHKEIDMKAIIKMT